jgi:hypothetical protein
MLALGLVMQLELVFQQLGFGLFQPLQHLMLLRVLTLHLLMSYLEKIAEISVPLLLYVFYLYGCITLFLFVFKNIIFWRLIFTTANNPKNNYGNKNKSTDNFP